MSIELTDDEFEALVDKAFSRIPDDLLQLIDNCLIRIETESSTGDSNLLGLYEGTSLTERGDYVAALPDVITLFQHPLCIVSNSIYELEEEIFVTLVHEIGHHFGISDQRLEELNWD